MLWTRIRCRRMTDGRKMQDWRFMQWFYLLTLAYQMFRAISTSHGNEQLVMIVATILFLIVGVGLIGFGLIAGYRNIKADHREDEK